MSSEREKIDVSIVIPCYNHGEYLVECLNSLPKITTPTYEVLIIDDGSNETETIKILEKISVDYQVLTKNNGGVASARNYGIKSASGDFILPLDADNKLHPNFLEETFNAINKDENIGVVYCNRIKFGELQNLDRPGVFDIGKIFLGNYIDACALIRKKLLIQCGGYDEKMPIQGLEDWELWINAHSKGWQFHYLNKALFYYRVRNQSMISGTKGEKYSELNRYVLNKHLNVFFNTYWEYYNEVNFFKRNPLKIFPRMIFKKYFGKLYKLLKNNFL